MNTEATRTAARATLLAGLLFLTHYAVQLAWGFRTGETLFPNTESFIARIDFFLFLGAWGLMGSALLTLRGLLSERGKVLGSVVQALIVTGLTAAAVAVFLLLFVPDISGLAEAVLKLSTPVVALSQIAAGVLIGGSLLRSRIVPRWIPALVLVFGVTTAPLALTFSSAFGPYLPEYTWSEAHIAWTGALWFAVGFGLLRLYYESVETQPVPKHAVQSRYMWHVDPKAKGVRVPAGTPALQFSTCRQATSSPSRKAVHEIRARSEAKAA